MMEISQFAPVLIPTLNRYEHLRRCVESLSRCTHADKTDLYIALDYPANDSHWEGYNKIKDYLNEISGFKSVNIIIRDKNFGATQNFTDAREQIFQKYDRIIFSEDDNEFSPNFLDYINKGLDKFEDDPRVIAICGYIYPFKTSINSEYKYFYGKAFSAWGYGSWKNKPPHSEPYSSLELNNFLKSKFIRNKIKYYDERKLYLIKDYLRYNIEPYGDRSVVINILVNDKYCIFPTISKVRNWGHDGTGIHCGEMNNDIFRLQPIDKNLSFEYYPETPINDKYFTNLLRNYFKLPIKTKIKKNIKYILNIK